MGKIQYLKFTGQAQEQNENDRENRKQWIQLRKTVAGELQGNRAATSWHRGESEESHSQ